MTEDSPTANIPYYDRLAGNYDLFFADYLRNMEEEGTWLDGWLGGRGARTILDASCGTGRQAIPLALRGYSVVATDPSEEMLSTARRLAQERNAPLALVRSTFDDLPTHIPAAFDAVIALGNGLCNLPTRAAIAEALRAMRLCCKPGGACLIGIKDFDAVAADRLRFRPHRIDMERGRGRMLFEIWSVARPILTSTAYLLQRSIPGEPWRILTARTREYMLCVSEIEELAHDSGFVGVEPVAHPAEKVYAFYP